MPDRIPDTARRAPTIGQTRTAIAEARVFRGLAGEVVDDLAQRMIPGTFPRGRALIDRDSVSEVAFLILSGNVERLVYGHTRAVTLSLLRTGDWFGDEAVLDPGRAVATCVATRPTAALGITRAQLVLHLERFPDTVAHLACDLARRLRDSDETIADLATSDVETRLVRRLGQIANHDGQMLPDGVLIARPNQQELASMIGARRETVSRLYSRFVREGMLVARGNRVLVSTALLARASPAHAARVGLACAERNVTARRARTGS